MKFHSVEKSILSLKQGPMTAGGCCDQPHVSVVMASYNYGRYIAQAIQSVCDQTYSKWDLVIIDDGSKDNTESVVKPFLAEPRIRYYYQENQGQPLAKNAGIKRALGDLIAFLDADDSWAPDKLALQVPLFEGDPRIGVTYTATVIMDEEGTVTGNKLCRRLRGNVFKESLYQTIPPFSSTIVRRAVLCQVGCFNESIPLAIDFELWLRVSMHYHFDFIDKPLLYYRTGHANLSSRFIERRQIVIDKILPHILNECGGRNLLSHREVALAYAKLFIGMAEDDLPQSHLSAFYWSVRALVVCPTHLASWCSVIRSCIPNTIARVIKKVVNSGVDIAHRKTSDRGVN